MVVALHDSGRKFLDKYGVKVDDRDDSFGPATLMTFPEKDRSGKTVPVHAIYCKNHLKKKNGTAWQAGDQPEPYKVHLNPDRPYHHLPLLEASVPPRAGFMLHEDTGQNLGPPVPPP